MRSVVIGVLIGLAALLIGGFLPRLDGHGPWIVARATGLTALVALSLDVALGLAMSTRQVGGWISRGRAVELHRWLSPLTLALLAGHVGVLLFDRYAGFGALDVVVPFASSWRPAAIAAGIVAGYLAVVVHVSFALRKRLGTATWRRLHYLSFPAFAAAALHAIAAGSDAFRPWAIAIAAPPMIIVVLLVARRTRLAVAGPAPSSGTARRS